MTTLLQNRPPMSDEQRRAMFARMRSRGGGGSRQAATDAAASVEQPRFESPEFADALFSNPVANPGDPYAVFTDPGYGQGPGFATQPPAPSTVDHILASAIMTLSGAQLMKAVPAIGAFLNQLGPLGRAIQSWKTPLAAGAAAWGIGEYREDHPTMDPRGEKALAIAQQIAGYVSALTGLGTAKTQVARALPGPVRSALTGALEKSGARLQDLGKAIAEHMPDWAKTPLGKAYQGYSVVADYTGASLSDLAAAPGAPGKFAVARTLEETAQRALQQADDIERAAIEISDEMKDKAGRTLNKSHKGSLAEWDSASRMYAEGAAKHAEARAGLAGSQRSAAQLRADAAKFTEQAAALRQEATSSAIKAALVAAGFGVKEAHEETTIDRYQRAMEDAWAQGEDYVLDPAQPRGPLATVGAALVGTLGNPVEKQTRYGQDTYAASVAAYRARYDAIGRAERTGEMSPGEAESERLKLAESKPLNMAGKGAWTFAPASAAFISWQAGNVKDYFDHEVEVGTVKRVLDGDTIELASGKIVRMMGVDTPESIHPDKPVEYLGHEASAFQKENLTGKTVRLVQSPGAGVDKYGRDLAYVETLPGPLDAAFKLPGVGKWIPGTDENKRLIDEGYGQPRYLELSGGHERQIEYDKATARAKAAGKGVHSAEGMEKLDYHYQTYDEKHGRTNTPPDSALQTALGLGLMATGQSGAFKAMGPSGNVAAQTWNALLAGLGAAEYNQKAAQRTQPVRYKAPKTVKTEYMRRAEVLIDARTQRNLATRP